MEAIVLSVLAAIGIQPMVFFVLFFVPLLVLGDDVDLSSLIGMPLFAAVISVPFILFIGVPAFFCSDTLDGCLGCR